MEGLKLVQRLIRLGPRVKHLIFNHKPLVDNNIVSTHQVPTWREEKEVRKSYWEQEKTTTLRYEPTGTEDDLVHSIAQSSSP